MEEDIASRIFVCQAVFLLAAPGDCWTCDRPMRFFALMALPPFGLTGDQLEFEADDVPMLREITVMPSAITPVISSRAGILWRPDYSRTSGQRYWMNHCEHCDATQGDFFVHGPDGAFWPQSDEQMDTIDALKIEGPHSFVDSNAAYSGAMQAWRERHDGIVRAPPPTARKPRRKRS